MTANALYLAATRAGDLSIVAPLAALYPVSTVILALASIANGSGPCSGSDWA